VHVFANSSFATSLRVLVAVGKASSAAEDAITTSIQVSSIAVAVWDDRGSIDIQDSSVLNEDEAIESRGVLGTAEVVVGIEPILAEVVLGLRAALRVGSKRIKVGTVAFDAPVRGLFATVTRIAVAILEAF